MNKKNLALFASFVLVLSTLPIVAAEHLDVKWEFDGPATREGYGRGEAMFENAVGMLRFEGDGVVFIELPDDMKIEVTAGGTGSRHYLGNDWYMLSGYGWVEINNFGSSDKMEVVFYGTADEFKSVITGHSEFGGEWTFTRDQGLMRDNSNDNPNEKPNENPNERPQDNPNAPSQNANERELEDEDEMEQELEEDDSANDAEDDDSDNSNNTEMNEIEETDESGSKLEFESESSGRVKYTSFGTYLGGFINNQIGLMLV